ncbi:probable sulfate transporter 4.2 isoform X1 [Beta vulgaris subsp. vulgaris]|uniref:probable sulfate transporter 4.2 isoform X1 n=1 Tax=Beta vulgaris subsp. vulgaris TaxID=3555 RepID=UPI0020366B6B|nr:probable sulfate transporter 4.2 isoform X1 [Beta vulgaris subsp. vulgaris]
MGMDKSYASPSSSDLAGLPRTYSNRPVKVIPLQHPQTTSSPAFSITTSSSSAFARWRSKMKAMTTTEWISLFLPCYRWLRSYNFHDYLQCDVMAGITVGVMLVPQAMSYAKLAGLAPIYGLYSGCLPVFIYAIFGSSRQLAVGPVALTSLLVSNVLTKIVSPSDKLYTELAITLSLMVGVLECLMGILRLGWIIRFISHAVISGFTTASAIVIALSQAKYFLGYDIVRSSEIIPLAKSIISGFDKFSWPPFVLGSLILAVMLTMKHLGKTRKYLRFVRAAGPLTGVVLGTVIVKLFHPSAISVVGEIPQGLPEFAVPKAFAYVKSLIPTAFLITGVAILESVGIAKALAAKNGYDLDSNQELFGLGVANIAGSFFSSYPSTGSFSRSAVNHESGAKTGFAGILTGIIMSCALLFLTPLFEAIPQCALAAIVISAVMGLVDYEEAMLLWRIDKKDFFLWTITFASTLFLGIEIGVLVGVGFSLAFVVHESANPHIAVLGRLPGTTIYRNVQQYPEAYTYHGIVLVRVDAPIYFANTSYIKDRLREYESNPDQSIRRGPEVEQIYFVILELSPVTYIDSSAVQALRDLYNEYKSRGIQIVISNPNQEVLMTLTRAGLVELIGKEWYFVRVHDAVQVCFQHVQENEMPKTLDSFNDSKRNLIQRLGQRKDNIPTVDLESGNQTSLVSSSSDHQLQEPLLPGGS